MFEGASREVARPRRSAIAPSPSGRGVGFVDAGEFIACSDLDGIHFERDGHAILGRVMAEAVRMTLA